MTLDALKSEVVKLPRAELFDFVQFILQSLKEKEVEDDAQTPHWLKADISKRAFDMKSGEAVTFNGQDIHQEINEKYGFDVPTSLLG